MRWYWGFLKEYKEMVEILRRRKQDHLELWGGDGENRERSEGEERNEGWMV